MADDILDRVRSFASRSDEQPVEETEAEPAETNSATCCAISG